MSIRGRYLIDRAKRFVGVNNFRFPVPPYGEPDYWNHAYASFGPEEYMEWGDVELDSILEYEHKRLDHEYNKRPTTADANSWLTTTFGSTLGVHPVANAGSEAEASSEQPILMLGCGNSRFGEEMINYGWKGPLVQVDCSNRVIEAMTHRATHVPLIKAGRMTFIQDDATDLSAIRDGMMHGCIDKGLVDALFCADEYEQCQQVLRCVHRVLKPGASFVLFSFSGPDFLLPQCLNPNIRKTQAMWTDIQIHELSNILLYKFQKRGNEVEPTRITSAPQKRGRR